jgi:hypothetical protein
VVVAADPEESGPGGHADGLIEGGRGIGGHDDFTGGADGLLIDHGGWRRADRHDAAGGPGEDGDDARGANQREAREMLKCIEVHDIHWLHKQ